MYSLVNRPPKGFLLPVIGLTQLERERGLYHVVILPFPESATTDHVHLHEVSPVHALEILNCDRQPSRIHETSSVSSAQVRRRSQSTRLFTRTAFARGR